MENVHYVGCMGCGKSIQKSDEGFDIAMCPAFQEYQM